MKKALIFSTTLAALVILAHPAWAKTKLVPLEKLTHKYFKGNGAGEFPDKEDPMAVLGYRVGFITGAGAGARAEGGGGASAKLRLYLGKNITDADLQAVVEEAYADYLAKLKATGRPVIEIGQVLAHEAFAGVPTEKTPYYQQAGKAAPWDAAFFTPAGIPLWFLGGDNYGNVGIFNLKPQLSLKKILGDLKATGVAPQVLVRFANFESSGWSNFGNAAKVNAELNLSFVKRQSGAFVMSPKGNGGGAELKEDIQLASGGGSTSEISKDSNQDSARWSGERVRSVTVGVYNPDPAQFKAAVLEGLKALNTAIVEASNR